MFDVDTFMQTTFNEENSTRREPIPVGEYQASIEKVVPSVTQNGSALLRVTWRISYPDDSTIDGRLVDQSIWLDLAPSGGLDMGKGKNIGLGRLREALGQNRAGLPWQPGMLLGAVATVSISHRVDKENPEILYDQVKGVAAA